MEFGEIILKVIEENLEDQVTCTELLDILRIHQGDIFRSASNLEFASVIEFLIRNSLTEYRLPIEEYKEKIKETINEESIACLEKDDRLKAHVVAKLNTIIAEVECSIEKTVQSQCESKDFIGTLFSNMKGLKKPDNDIETYKMLRIEDKVQFASVLITQLKGSIYERFKKEIGSWDVRKMVQSKRLTEFTFEEIIGCIICWVQHSYIRHGDNGNVHYLVELQFFGEGKVGKKDEQLNVHSCSEGEGSQAGELLIKLVP